MEADINVLFKDFNGRYFDQKLDAVQLGWSDKMTLCTGKTYVRVRGERRLCSIRLSKPLLSQRPLKDTINTLLHEMIHAYLHITLGKNYTASHGPEFKSHMHRINNAHGSKITIFHNFLKEVDKFRVHVYKCSGPCQYKKPLFGVLKRAIKRPPGPTDAWWEKHKEECGGTYIKIKGPEIEMDKSKSNGIDLNNSRIKKKIILKKQSSREQMPGDTLKKKPNEFKKKNLNEFEHSSLVTKPRIHNFIPITKKFKSVIMKYINKYNESLDQEKFILIQNIDPINEDMKSLKQGIKLLNENIESLHKDMESLNQNNHFINNNPHTDLSDKQNLNSVNGRIDPNFQCKYPTINNIVMKYVNKYNNSISNETNNNNNPRVYESMKQCSDCKKELKNKDQEMESTLDLCVDCLSKEFDTEMDSTICPNCNNEINKEEFAFHMQFCD